MSPAAPKWEPKHAWAKLERENLPKRAPAQRIADYEEIHQSFDEATVREQASRCLTCPNPVCVQGCLLNNRIPEWLALAAEGQFIEAARVSLATSNMPEICSRLCPQDRLCEGACILNGPSEPVPIGAIERFIHDYAFVHGAIHIHPALPNGRRVAVVGSGPGGLACADELAKLGYAVMVYDAHPVPGGLLMNAIPSFRLSKEVVRQRVEILRQRGVEFKLGVKLGRDLSLAELQRANDAVFLAIGAHKPRPLDVPGADLKGVYQAMHFLTQIHSPTPPGNGPIAIEGRRVAVLGGGDTAIDCLRTAIRCKAREVTCLYRRDYANVPCNRRDYEDALEEGTTFLFLTLPVGLVGNLDGDVTHIRCVRTELGEPDAGGRLTPRPIPGSEFEVPADLVVVAYGFDPVPLPAQSDLGAIAVGDNGAVIVDSHQMTSTAGIFAGGNLVRRRSLVGEAVLDGRRAAAGIHQFLLARR